MASPEQMQALLAQSDEREAQVKEAFAKYDKVRFRMHHAVSFPDLSRAPARCHHSPCWPCHEPDPERGITPAPILHGVCCPSAVCGSHASPGPIGSHTSPRLHADKHGHTMHLFFFLRMVPGALTVRS